MKFAGVDQITYKNFKESNPTHANQILLSLNNEPIIGRSNAHLFSYTVSNGIKPLQDQNAFPADS